MVARLTELPQFRYDDPLTRIDWDAVDCDCWWLPPAALSLAGVPEFEALPESTRRRLSHLEYVHLLQAGLRLEARFMAHLAVLGERCADMARRARFLHEVREEAGHSLMFLELLHRSGYGLDPARTPGMRLLDGLGRLLPSGSALFWAMVVAGEELPDRLNRRLRRGIEEATLSAVVYRMAQIHIRDEAAHAAYAREQCREAASRCAGWQRALLSVPLSAGIELYARHVYYPPASVYRRCGLLPAAGWRARALANPNRRRDVAEMMRPTLQFLASSGWRVVSRCGTPP